MEEFFNPDSDTIGSKGLVYIGDKVLVYRRDGNTANHPHELDLPGGGPEGDETPFQTFKRETKEEFGLDINEEDVVYVRRYESTLNPGRFAYFPVAKLAAENAGKIALGNEGEEYLLLTDHEYVQRDDCWQVFQERTADYLGSQAS